MRWCGDRYSKQSGPYVRYDTLEKKWTWLRETEFRAAARTPLLRSLFSSEPSHTRFFYKKVVYKKVALDWQKP